MSELLENFSSLPPSLQAAMMTGVAIGGVIVIVWKVRSVLTSKDASSPEKMLITETIRLATALADEKLRTDLVEILRAAREALEGRIDKVAEEMREQIRRLDIDGSSKRQEIYRRFEEIDRRANDMATKLAAIRPARSR